MDEKSSRVRSARSQTWVTRTRSEYLALLVEHAAVSATAVSSVRPVPRAFWRNLNSISGSPSGLARRVRLAGCSWRPRVLDPRLQGVQAVQPDAHFLRLFALVAVGHTPPSSAVGHGDRRSKSMETRLVSPVAGSKTSTPEFGGAEENSSMIGRSRSGLPTVPDRSTVSWPISSDSSSSTYWDRPSRSWYRRTSSVSWSPRGTALSGRGGRRSPACCPCAGPRHRSGLLDSRLLVVAVHAHLWSRPPRRRWPFSKP